MSYNEKKYLEEHKKTWGSLARDPHAKPKAKPKKRARKEPTPPQRQQTQQRERLYHMSR